LLAAHSQSLSARGENVMKMANGTTGSKLIALAATLLFGTGTLVAQQEINPDHFEDNATNRSAAQSRTHARNLQKKTKQTKQAQAGQKRREYKKSQPRKVARADPHDMVPTGC